MTREQRNFSDRPESERRIFIEDTWCNICNAADLGLNDPVEYEEDDNIFIEGKCRKCGNRVVSRVILKHVE